MIVKFEDLKWSPNAMIHEITRFLEIDSSSTTVDMAIEKIGSTNYRTQDQHHFPRTNLRDFSVRARSIAGKAS